jgi:hypothetical protein
MNRDKTTRWIAAGRRTLFALLFVFPYTLCAQPPGASCKQSSTPHAKQRTGDPHEGIKVHGHWTIEVRNADGTLVTHREFENSLWSGGGDGVLVSALSRQFVNGLWMIGLNNFGGTGVCPHILTNQCPGSCCLVEAGSTQAVDGHVFKTLTVQTTSDPLNPHLILSGTLTASVAGGINQLFSDTLLCSASVLPGNCLEANSVNGGLYRILTSTTITPVNATIGQLIQVTVDISFS